MVGVEHMYVRVEKEDLDFGRQAPSSPPWTSAGSAFPAAVSPNAAHLTDGTTTLYSHRHVSDCVQSILFILIYM